MSNENYMEIYKQLSFGQDKHTYFQLTVSMASIGFAITQTQNIPLNITQAPLGLAILAWAISFHCGLKNRAYYLSTLYANANLFKITQGLHPDVGQNPRFIQAAAEGTSNAMNKNSKTANNYAKMQTKLLVLGAILYIIWHVLEMYMLM